MVRTLHSHAGAPGSIPGQGTRIPQATQCSQKGKKINWELAGKKQIPICLMIETEA